MEKFLELSATCRILMIMVLLAVSTGNGQNYLINGANGGGFELGSTFAANNWTVLNGSSTSRVWQIGTGQAGFTGSRAGFIGDNSTTVGSTTEGRIVHLYRQVNVPSEAGYMTLRFKYKQASLHAGQDGLNVYISSQLPQAGVLPVELWGTTTKIKGDYPSASQPDFSECSVHFDANAIQIPPTAYLIFSFYADNTDPHAYGAIDDIELDWHNISATTFIPQGTVQYQGQDSVAALGISFYNEYGTPREIVSSITFTTGITTNTEDIDSAKVFFSYFPYINAQESPFGETVIHPNGTFTVTGLTWAAVQFWVHLVYYVRPDAQVGNELDASCTAYTTMAGGSYRPVMENPAGTLPILSRLSGLVTVGAGGTYTSLSQPGGLFNAINVIGLSGNLTANIISDLTETGEVQLDRWLEGGMPGNYTLTIKPDAATLRTISGTGTSKRTGNFTVEPMIQINSADRVILDGSYNGSGNYLQFINSSTSVYAMNLLLSVSDSDPLTGVTIKNCTFTGPATEGGCGIQGLLYNSSTASRDINILNNRFNRLETAIIFGACSPTVRALTISGNEIGSATAANSIRLAGISISTADSVVIRNNTIFNFTGTGTWCRGIEVGGLVSNLTIDANLIRKISSSQLGSSGISIYPYNSTAGNILIKNNIISEIGGPGNLDNWDESWYANAGIRLGGAVNGVELYYNTVYLSGTYSHTADTIISAAISIGEFCTNLKMKDNIFFNSIFNDRNSTAKSYALYAKAPPAVFAQSDYNSYFVSGSQGVLAYCGGELVYLFQLTMASGGDAHSSQLQPQLSYYNMKPFTTSPLIGSGTPVAGITTDYAGTSRGSTPTIGAYESSQLQSAVDWCSFSSPATALVTSTGVYTAYARVYEPGITNAAGQGAGIEAWIGWSRTNTDPATWDNWYPASYSGDVSNLSYDEYRVDLNSVLPNGTYYSASRFRIENGAFQYGGINVSSTDGGGFWNGTTMLSGRISVNDATTLTVPYGVVFTEGSFPAFWSQSSNVESKPEPWTSAYGGRMMHSQVQGTGTTRLIAGKFTTPGYDSISVRFESYMGFTSKYPGLVLKIQSSPDGINWTDESYTYSSASGDKTNHVVSATIKHNLGGDTYIAWTAEGNLSLLSVWYVSNVDVRAVPTASAEQYIIMSSALYTFAGTGMKFQFTTTINYGITLVGDRIPASPGGVLPAGIVSIPSVYWTVKLIQNTMGGVFSFTFDVTGIPNTGKVTTIHLLRRNNPSSLWVDLGVANTINRQLLTWTGQTAIGEFALGITQSCLSPVITAQPDPQAQSVCLNGTLPALSVSATGSSLTYQWYSNTAKYNYDGTVISGAVSSSYQPPSSAVMSNYYYAVVSDTCGSSVASNCSGLIRASAPSVFSVQPNVTRQYYCYNSVATALSVTGTATNPTYQWYVNSDSSNTGGSAISGAVSSAYTPPTTGGGIFYYYCVLSGDCNSAASNPSGRITVYAPVKPTGAGTAGDPYLIATYFNLLWISNSVSNYGYYYKQTADIDATNTACTVWPIGNDGYKFTGTYDGQNYTITNFRTAGINYSGTYQFGGLFGYTSNATLANIRLVNVTVTATNYAGALAGYVSGGTITGCSSSGTVTITGSTAGGLIGYLNRANLTNSSSTVTVTATGDHTGGLVGVFEQLLTDAPGTFRIQGCYSAGTVTGARYAGGLVGTTLYGSIYNCYSKTNVQRVSGGTSSAFGAFIAYDVAKSGYTIANCYSTGNVTYLGGTSPNALGFSGSATAGVTYTNNYFDSTLSNQVTGTGATAKTTALMQTFATYTGWDFLNETANGTNDYWGINTNDNGGYPFLSWQGFYNTANNYVTVSGTGYGSLSAACTGINNGAHSGDITVVINESIAETASSTLYGSGGVFSVSITNGGAAYTSAPTVTFSAPPAGGVRATGTAVKTGSVVTSITITNRGSGYVSAPSITFSGGAGNSAAATAQIATYSSITMYPRIAGKTVACSLAAPLILLDGADNVAIDGRVGGAGSTADLTLTNAYATASTAASTIRFINGASGNTVRYCNINGSNRDPGTGTVHFGTTTALAGNNNNVLDHNNISNGGTRPYMVIYSLGTASYPNSGNTISNNSIYDYQNATGNSSAVYLYLYSTNFQVTGNSIYETASVTNTAIDTTAFIYVNNGNPVTITGNYIGGSDAQCGGAAKMTKAGSSNLFYGIHLASVSAATASTVSGNVIDNISWTNTANADWQSIYLQAGSATISGNRIGDTTGTSSILLTNATTGGTFYGITSAGTATIQNNIIGAIDLSNGATLALNFTGITCTATSTVSGNTIGSAGTANSIKLFSASTANAQTAVGIKITGAGTNTVSNNIISNIVNGTTNTTAATAGLVQGINVSAGTTAVTGNTVSDLTISNANTGADLSASVAGIIFSVATAAAQNISGNTVFNLSNSYASFAGNIIGMYYSGSTTASVVSGNRIYGLTVPGATSTTASVYGIKIAAGATKYYNNMITLGGNTKTTLYGIYETGAASNNNSLYFNSVYLIGSLVSGATNKSYALYSNASTNLRDFRNNIFYNGRSTVGATNLHGAVFFNYTVTTNLTLNYNIYIANGTGGVLGWRTTTAVTTLPLMTAMDANSKLVAVYFTSASDLHLSGGSINDQNLKVLPIAGITTDFDGELRHGSWPYIGADENIDSPLPVELTSFSGKASGRQVLLNWNTATEISNSGFNIERRKEEGAWEKIHFIPGRGTCYVPTDYSYIDKKPWCGTLYYRLEQVSIDGASSYSGTITVKVDFPNRFDISQNYPNPFNPVTVINYDVPLTARVRLTVYDFLGNEIMKLLDEEKDPGAYSVQFSGDGLPSGIYYYRLLARDYSGTRKMLLIK